MKNTIKSINYLLSAFILIAAANCTHDTDGLEEATSYPATAEVFIDEFTADLQYAAFGGSDVKAFDVDPEVKYKGISSMRIAVPDKNDPNGSYAGGAYYSTFGRDLSGYNCLTFWAKATKWASVDKVGFGIDLDKNQYEVSISGLAVNTNWKKYCIPLPIPAKLKSEKGMFFFAEGPEEDRGYTFWIDEVKFEKLDTIAFSQPKILNGADSATSSYIGESITIGNGSGTFNLPDGTTRDVTVSASYFDFSSSNTSVATVDEGVVTVRGNGSATISAKVDGVDATGTLTVTSRGTFSHAPRPATDSGNVISIFSDDYTSVPVDFFNGYWEPYQNTQLRKFAVDGDNILNYTNFNFVGNGFGNPGVDASNMSHIHFDVYVPTVTTEARLKITLRDFGPNGVDDGGKDDDTDFPKTFDLTFGKWNSLDISIQDMARRNKVSLIIYEKDSSTLSDFYLDNIYFYKE